MPLVRFLFVAGCLPDEAEDVAQESFLIVAVRWDRVREMENARAYLYQVAIHLGRRAMRQRPPVVAWDAGEDLVNFPDPADAYRAAEEQADLMALLHQLPAGQRQVLWLRDAADFSTAETAEILSLRPGTVKSQLHDARAGLRELMLKSRGDDTR